MGLPEVDNLAELFVANTPLIDVRAPVEFARGAFPGAVNLPLLDDQQRELVGKRYKESGQQAAIALGESLVTVEIRQHRLDIWCDFLQQHPQARLYCFRGGLRSKITQQWLSEAGVTVPRVRGGYKRMRQYLLGEIERCSEELPLVVLGGRTGSGKTRLLLRLSRYIDLEGLAGHRGSSFGRMARSQPATIDFENALAIELLRQRIEADAALQKKPVFLEDEAKLIGRVAVPEVLRERMAIMPVVILEESLERRIEVARGDYVDELLENYQVSLGEEAGFFAWIEHHRQSLLRIRKRLGGSRTKEASALLERAVELHSRKGVKQGYDAFIAFLLTHYYDPMYDYQLSRKQRPVVFRGNAQAIYQWSQQTSVNEIMLQHVV